MQTLRDGHDRHPRHAARKTVRRPIVDNTFAPRQHHHDRAIQALALVAAVQVLETEHGGDQPGIGWPANTKVGMFFQRAQIPRPAPLVTRQNIFCKATQQKRQAFEARQVGPAKTKSRGKAGQKKRNTLRPCAILQFHQRRRDDDFLEPGLPRK